MKIDYLKKECKWPTSTDEAILCSTWASTHKLKIALVWVETWTLVGSINVKNLH